MQGESTISTPSEGHSDGNQRMLHGRTSGPARRSTRGQWTAEEDEILRKAVQRFKGKNWKKIAECFKDRTDVQCLHRWQKVLNPELVKGPWTKEEDEVIIQLVHKYGPKKWSTIAQHLPGRIGKQCRERWHNHLNPAINKEAWTQEEELILIRAHQTYGNRWAELTKFLPGRTDNGIKNHWHSSVKKKLDSYLASGFLEQIQALPLVPFQNNSMLSSSAMMQRNGDESFHRGEAESEEESQCSQSSSMVGCSQSASDLPNAVINTGEQFHPIEMPGGEEQSTIPVYCLEQYYYQSSENITFSIPEVPCEAGHSSKFPDQKFSHDVATSSCPEYQFSLQELPNIASLELGHESSGMPTLCTNESHQVTEAPAQTSNIEVATDNGANILISDHECCRVLFPDVNDGYCASGTLTQDPNMIDLPEYQGSLPCPSSDIQIPEIVRISASENYPSKAVEASCSENLRPAPLLISADKYGKELTQLICHPFEAEPKCNTNTKSAFIYVNNSASSPCDDDGNNNSEAQEQQFHVNDSIKLVPVNDFASQPEVNPGLTPVKDESNVDKEQAKDTGALCYEPPRFPSLDVPFFSCDLIQAKSDLLQEFSPLGIRQLLMSSMTCMSPLRLWDSPSRDHSPNAILKTGVRTFNGAASILRKRHRDLLSPLAERRSDKKLETDITSTLAKDFSCLDVIFDEGGNHKSSLLSPLSAIKNNHGASSEDKENQGHTLNGVLQGKGRDNASFSNEKVPDETLNVSNSHNKIEHNASEVNVKDKDDAKAEAKNEQQLSGVLVERNINRSLLFSSDQSGSIADTALVSSSQTPRNQFCGSLIATPKQDVTSVKYVPSSGPTKNTNTASITGGENLSIFCGTPFRRSLESPSAWKSPLFINSLLCSPRFDTEITIEDIGYLLSPGDTSYDAIGLMKQLSEHTAGTFADAFEVLGKDSPETIFKQKQSKMNKENARVAHDQIENHPNPLASNVLAERRSLDFSDCGSPGRGRESRKASASKRCLSPSYLLKGCR